jgi:MoaA/NifB/PqqE/SkfB family radical SAM enzyme
VAGVRIVDFTGGEPLLHPDLPRFLRAAKKVGLKTTVTTNGLLYPKLAPDLAGWVDLLHISIDGAQAETHDRLRGIACYEKVMESVETALSLGERPDLLFTAGSGNYQDVIPLADFAERRGLVLIVNPVFEACGGNGILTREQLLELEDLCRKPNIYLNAGVVQLMKEGGNQPEHPRCRAVSATLVISPKNELLLPCFHHARTAIPIRGNLIRALESELRKRAMRDQGRWDFCRGCTINCYLAPSLPYKWDRYFSSFLPWAWKYIRYRARSKRSSAAV